MSMPIQEYFRKQQPPTLITWGKNESLRWRVLNSLKEIFPVQSSIFSTRAISLWKKKWTGLGR